MKKFLEYAFKLLIIAAALLAVTACPDRGGKLRDRSREFSERLRWQQIEPAKTYLEKELLAEVGAQFDLIGDKLIITNYEIKHFVLDEEAGKALVSVEYSWHTPPEVTIKTASEMQTWNLIDGQWFLAGAKGEMTAALKKLAEGGGESNEGEGETKESIPKVYQRKPDI